MPVRVVCNASPLIFLAKINSLRLLDDYSLHIPNQVKDEVLAGHKKGKADACLILDYLDARKIEPVRVVPLRSFPAALGSGEKASITLAVRLNLKTIFIDESKARSVARVYGLEPKGTLGILWESYRDGKLNKAGIERLIYELVEKGFRIKEELLIEFLRALKDRQ